MNMKVFCFIPVDSDCLQSVHILYIAGSVYDKLFDPVYIVAVLASEGSVSRLD